VGYTAFNSITGEILETSGDYIKISKPLYPFIINLTGITQNEIDTRGISISQSYKNLINFCEKHEIKFGQMVTWGSGDLDEYKKCMGNLVAVENLLCQLAEDDLAVLEAIVL
jgi:inhibitor of KinA sporulation pathway (predicted exonuclease)